MDELDFMQKFSQSIRQHRANKEMTIQDFADFIGVSKNTIINYENGHSMPLLYMSMLIAAKLGITIDELVGMNTHA